MLDCSRPACAYAAASPLFDSAAFCRYARYVVLIRHQVQADSTVSATRATPVAIGLTLLVAIASANASTDRTVSANTSGSFNRIHAAPAAPRWSRGEISFWWTVKEPLKSSYVFGSLLRAARTQPATMYASGTTTSHARLEDMPSGTASPAVPTTAAMVSTGP